MAKESYGKVVQVIGPVIDVEFAPADMPEIFNALELDEKVGDLHVKLTSEVQQHLGRNQVRAISMSTTDGVVRGMKVRNTGAAISVPIGMNTLGRVFNLLGETVDHGAPFEVKERRPIHQHPPEFKAVGEDGDLRDGHQGGGPAGAVRQGRQDRALWWRGRRQDRGHHGAHPQHREGARRFLGVLRRGGADP